MRAQNVADADYHAVLKALRETLRLARLTRDINVVDFDKWRHPQWLDGKGQLRPHGSVDWYIQQGITASQRTPQLNAKRIIADLFRDPWQRVEPHYDVLVLEHDLYCDNRSFIVGLALPGIASIISTHRFTDLETEQHRECVKTLSFHEIGHMLGLPGATRTEERPDAHCPNKCVMRQGLSVPLDWLEMTDERLQLGAPFCAECLRDLLERFR